MILAITPGPDMTLFVSRTLSQGRAAGFASMAGALTGVIDPHYAGGDRGLGAYPGVADGFPRARRYSARAISFSRLSGAALRLGFLRQEKSGPSISVRRKAIRWTWRQPDGTPRSSLFFVTFLPQFVSAHDPNAAGKLFFLGVMSVLISIPVTAPMVFAADWFAAAMKKSPRVTRFVDYLFAGVFSAFALRIITAQAS